MDFSSLRMVRFRSFETVVGRLRNPFGAIPMFIIRTFLAETKFLRGIVDINFVSIWRSMYTDCSSESVILCPMDRVFHFKEEVVHECHDFKGV
ncbi:hypothetical protein BXT84_14750 [Sulfobacillus thermotolerans]|uniref:Uncharacterized protein n=1 Tax=Sulfobacillus thermotolerans TaxID=338644 RepID=A0ABM6RU76_9FIRM|nr:hypothetical protein BXT84_14750 [Sulfobacillus thermotolerans]